MENNRMLFVLKNEMYFMDSTFCNGGNEWGSTERPMKNKLKLGSK